MKMIVYLLASLRSLSLPFAHLPCLNNGCGSLVIKHKYIGPIKDWYWSHKCNTGMSPAIYGFFNHAAIITEGDTNTDGSNAKPWMLCTVKQVEDLKVLIRIFPIWSASVILTTPIAIQPGLTILQVLTMDRHIGPHFKFPAGSILVIATIATSLSLALIDRIIWPAYKKITGRVPTPLQRIGFSYTLNVLSLALSALVESKRLKIAHSHKPGSPVLISALWLFPQLVLAGIGEAFHLPGQFTFYFQEFPSTLRGTSTAMIALVIGFAYYLSTALVDLMRRVTSWLPDDINKGRIDNVYWTLVGFGVVFLGHYFICSKLYKYQDHEIEDIDEKQEVL